MLPFGRIKEIIKNAFSHTVSVGTIWNWEKEFSKKLIPLEDTIKQEIIDGNVACLDETGTRSEKKNFWVHEAVNPNFSHFSFHNKREFDGMIADGILTLKELHFMTSSILIYNLSINIPSVMRIYYEN